MTSWVRVVLARRILLDIKMPRVDGFEVLRRVSVEPRVAAAPVVMFSSSDAEDGIVQSYRLGVVCYVIKPLRFSDLCDTVRGMVNYWLTLYDAP